MSEFTDGATTPTEEPAGESTTEDYLAEMVGEGKKYGTVEDAAKALAKKAVNADTFIETLKTEKRQLEEQYQELQTRNKSIDEIVQALRQPDPPKQEPPTPKEPEQDNMSVDQIIAELERRTQEKTAAQQREDAIKKTWEALGSPEVFGDLDKAKTAVASYIGKDPNRKALVDQMAIADPQGLVALLKQNREVVTFSENQTGKATEPGMSNTGKLTWDAVRKIRKENPKLYNSKAFQQRMHTEL